MKKLLILLPVTLLAVGTVIGGMACNDTDNGDTSINIEQLRDGISVAVGGMDTYQYIGTSEAQATMETDTGTEESESSAEINGIVDNTNQKMHITISRESEGPEGTFSRVTEQYIINDMVYTKSGMNEQWTKQPLTSGLWEQNTVEGQIEILEYSEIEILGSEEVNGVECWLVKLLNTQEAYWETQELMSPEELSMKFWFAKDTYYLMKAEKGLTYLLESGYSTTTRGDIEYSHYNESVSIELPEEAEAAESAE